MAKICILRRENLSHVECSKKWQGFQEMEKFPKNGKVSKKWKHFQLLEKLLHDLYERKSIIYILRRENLSHVDFSKKWQSFQKNGKVFKKWKKVFKNGKKWIKTVTSF